MSFWDRPVYFTRDKVIIHLPLVVCNLFEGRLYINLRLSIAQNEADLGGERIGAVLDSKVKHGTVVSGKIPFGYRINEEKRLEVLPQDAAIILDAFEHYRSTVSVRATAAYIRQTYGLNWDNVRCHLNLCQTLYIGHYESNGRVNPNFCPPIVPRDLYDDVQKLLSNNTKANPTERVFLFTSLLICAECGHRLAGIKNGITATAGAGHILKERPPLPFFPVRRLRALFAPSPERGSRPPRAAPDLCPDRLRQSGFSIFHRPFAIPPSWFSGMKKGLDLSCQAPVVGLPPFPAPMKKPPFVVKERFFSRLAVHYFVFYMYPFVHCCK